MLSFMNFWFTSMLFCGNLINLNDVPWPFKIMTWTFPLNWALRTFMALEFSASTHFGGASPLPNGGFVCDPIYQQTGQPCYGFTGEQALDGAHLMLLQHVLPFCVLF